MSPKQAVYAKALFAVVVWGASFVATKVAFRHLMRMEKGG